MQVPEQYSIKESVFHLNSLTVREEGKRRDEMIVLCSYEGRDHDEFIAKTIEL